MKYRIEVSEKQLHIIMRALERYFRINMGQFFDYVEEIAFEGFDYSNHTDEDFDNRIDRRNDAEKILNSAYRILKPDLSWHSENTQRAIDIFTTFRYRLWEWKPEPKAHDTVESRKPLPFIAEELPKIERVL